MVLGSFYEANEGTAVYNKNFRPFRSPAPFMLVRPAILDDWKFFLENEEWLDILLWGHQITLQHRPEEVLPASKQGTRHFGVVLPWAEWERHAERVERRPEGVLEGPAIKLAGTVDEHAKIYLRDPSGNVIELKAYRNAQRTLGLSE